MVHSKLNSVIVCCSVFYSNPNEKFCANLYTNCGLVSMSPPPIEGRLWPNFCSKHAPKVPKKNAPYIRKNCVFGGQLVPACLCGIRLFRGKKTSLQLLLQKRKLFCPQVEFLNIWVGRSVGWKINIFFKSTQKYKIWVYFPPFFSQKIKKHLI